MRAKVPVETYQLRGRQGNGRSTFAVVVRLATCLVVGVLWADTCCGQAVAGPDRDTNDGWPRGAVGLLEAILPHHGSSVEHLAFSPNGELLATAVSTKSSVWDAASGRRLAHLELKRGMDIAAVGFFADGDKLLNHAWGSETFVWSVAKRRWVPGPSFRPPLPRDARLVEVSRDGRNALFRTRNGLMLYDTGSGRRIGALTADSESHLSNFDLEATKVAFVIYRSKEKTRTIEIWDLAAEEQLCVLPEMETYISTFALSPTAETIVFATHEARIVQWDVATGKEIREFPGPGRPVKSLAFSADGRLLAAATYPHQVTVFDATTAQVRWRVQGHRPTGLRLVFSARGDTLATAGENNTLWLWDAETGKCKVRRGENGEPPSQCFRGPDGELIATLSVDKTLRDAGGRRIGQFRVGGFDTHGGGVQQIVFSPDGRLAADSRRKDAPAVRDAIVLRDVATGRTLASLSRGRNTRSAVGALSPDGRLQAAALSDGAVELSDVYYPDNLQRFGEYRGDRLRRFGKRLILRGHQAPVTCLAFSADGCLLAAGGRDKAVRIWSTADGHLTKTLRGHAAEITAVAVSPEGSRVASASADGSLWLWNLDTVTEAHQWKTGSAGTAVAFGPDGEQLAAGFADGSIVAWNTESKRQSVRLSGHETAVAQIAFSPDGKHLASGDRAGSVHLWDAAAGTQLRVLEDDAFPITGLLFLTEGRRLATANDRGKVVIWETQSGRLRNEVGGFGSGVLALAADVEDQLLVGLTPSMTCCFSDLRRGPGRALADPAAALRSSSEAILEFVFSPDGKKLAATTGTSLYLWTVPDGNLLGRFSIPTAWRNLVAFSPDGGRIAVAAVLAKGKEGAVLLDADSGRRLASIPAKETGRVRNLAFSPRDESFAIANREAAVHLWDSHDGHRLLSVAVPVAAQHIQYSPDGRRLGVLTGRQVTLLDVRSGKQARAFSSRSDNITSFCFLDDGSGLAVLEFDGTGTIWRLRGN